MKSQLLYNYNAYTHISLDWSLDGETWQTAGSIDMPGVKTITTCDFDLPAEADHAETLYLRWMPDTNGPIDGTTSENDGTAISNIFVLADAAVYDDGKAPVLVSTVPEDNAEGVSATGRIVLNFDERVKLSEDAVGYVNDERIGILCVPDSILRIASDSFVNNEARPSSLNTKDWNMA